MWKRLELNRFLWITTRRKCLGRGVAAVLTINRLCALGSELAIEQGWYPTTALDDLLGIEEEQINDTRLYRCLDRVLPHKTLLSAIIVYAPIQTLGDDNASGMRLCR